MPAKRSLPCDRSIVHTPWCRIAKVISKKAILHVTVSWGNILKYRDMHKVASWLQCACFSQTPCEWCDSECCESEGGRSPACPSLSPQPCWRPKQERENSGGTKVAGTKVVATVAGWFPREVHTQALPLGARKVGGNQVTSWQWVKTMHLSGGFLYIKARTTQILNSSHYK